MKGKTKHEKEKTQFFFLADAEEQSTTMLLL